MLEVIEKFILIYGEKHRKLIEDAVAFVVSREYWQQKKWNWDHYFEDLIR